MERQSTEEIIYKLVERRQHLYSFIQILSRIPKGKLPSAIWVMKSELEKINWLLEMFSELGNYIPDKV